MPPKGQNFVLLDDFTQSYFTCVIWNKMRKNGKNEWELKTIPDKKPKERFYLLKRPFRKNMIGSLRA